MGDWGFMSRCLFPKVTISAKKSSKTITSSRQQLQNELEGPHLKFRFGCIGYWGTPIQNACDIFPIFLMLLGWLLLYETNLIVESRIHPNQV